MSNEYVRLSIEEVMNIASEHMEEDAVHAQVVLDFAADIEKEVASRCRAQGGSTSDNITQAAANKAAEEGGLPALQFDVETRDELTDDQNQRLDNLRTLNELLICFSSWEPQVCVVGNVRAGDSVNAIRAAIAADRASRQVANKAEVDLSSLFVQTGAEIETVYVNREEEFVRLDDVKALLATPPATTGASTVLTDERIKEIAEQHIRDGGWAISSPVDFARAIEREVAAQAGQVAAPGDFVLMPKEPSHLMIAAMACSQAKDDEGEFPSMLDLLDFSGENKAHAVLKAAYHAAVDAARSPAKESK